MGFNYPYFEADLHLISIGGMGSFIKLGRLTSGFCNVTIWLCGWIGRTK